MSRIWTSKPTLDDIINHRHVISTNRFSNYHLFRPIYVGYDEVIDLVIADNGGLRLLHKRAREIIDSEMQSHPWRGLWRLLEELDGK